MTSKHFIIMAKALRNAYPTEDKQTRGKKLDALDAWIELVDSLATVCKEINPQFNRGKFLSACYPHYREQK